MAIFDRFLAIFNSKTLFFSLIQTTRNRKLNKFGRRRRKKRVFEKPRFSKFFENYSPKNFNFNARRKWSPNSQKCEISCEIFSFLTIYDGSAQNGVKLIQLQKNEKHFINLWLIGGDQNLFLSRIARQNIVVSQKLRHPLQFFKF